MTAREPYSTAPTSSTCAICVATIRGEVHREPLGKDDAMVAVCSSCATDSPTSRVGPERGYDCDDLLERGSVGFSRKVRTAHKRIVPARRKAKRSWDLKGCTPTPGFVLERFPRVKVNGRFLTRVELTAAVAKMIAHHPWASEARFLGTTNEWAIFERPDPQFVARSRASDKDPLAALRGLEDDELEGDIDPDSADVNLAVGR